MILQAKRGVVFYDFIAIMSSRLQERYSCYGACRRVFQALYSCLVLRFYGFLVQVRMYWRV